MSKSLLAGVRIRMTLIEDNRMDSAVGLEPNHAWDMKNVS
jgi:hypothetical protein